MVAPNTAFEFGKLLVERTRVEGDIPDSLQSRILAVLMFGHEEREEMIKDLSTTPAFQILDKRVELVLGVGSVSKDLVAWLSTMCDSPGDAIMYSAVLHYAKLNLKDTLPVSLSAFILRYFDERIPNKDLMSSMWKLQKIGSGEANKLDSGVYWSPELEGAS